MTIIGVKMGTNGGNKQGKSSDAPPSLFGAYGKAIERLLEDCAAEMGGCQNCGVREDCEEYQGRTIATRSWNDTPETLRRLPEVVGHLVKLRNQARHCRAFMQRFATADTAGKGRG